MPGAGSLICSEYMAWSSVVTIGNFDGVHAGHQAILARARQLADQHAAKVKAFTFDPHPARLLRPQHEPPHLMTLRRRIEALREAGTDEVIVLHPDRELLDLPPGRFIDQLVADHHPAAIVEGPDFRFGRGREGDVHLLTRLGAERGFRVEVVDKVERRLDDHHAVVVSSSVCRWLILRGRTSGAEICMGRPLMLDGKVVEGDKRGRTIGMPTINLALPLEMILPCDGVYAGAVELDDGRVFPAAISVGCKPTFGDKSRVVEAHLLDFAEELYGRQVTVMPRRWLRDQLPFPSPASLAEQLRRDVEQTRDLHRLGRLLPREAVAQTQEY